jgi:predicted pyridoxine 5'-phosphate oxidase superfamily flavin-nucleotide-binding protein
MTSAPHKPDTEPSFEPYFDIAFTPAVLDLQERKGSRGAFATSDGSGPPGLHTLSTSERELIATRDSFYMATVSETGWPYVQHRGGDEGFLSVVNDNMIGWVERNGNHQYVSTGNISANGRVAAIFVDYPSRRRLKVYGNATYHPDPSPELLASLHGDEIRGDGAITLEILATDWNCPKYITPRFTEDQVRAAIAPMQSRIDQLEAEVDRLREG